MNWNNRRRRRFDVTFGEVLLAFGLVSVAWVLFALAVLGMFDLLGV